MGLYTLGQYISASNSQISRNRSTFLLNAPLWWKKWALTHRIVHKPIGSARSQFLGIVHDSVFYPQLHRFFTVSGGWPLILKGITISFYLTPFCWKHKNFKIFMNMPNTAGGRTRKICCLDYDCSFSHSRMC